MSGAARIELMNAMNKSLLVTVTSLLLLAGCGRVQERSYASVAAMKDTGDYPVVVRAMIPEDATKIAVRTSVESGEYYVSYESSDLGHVIRSLNMSQVAEADRKRAQDSLGFGVKLPPDTFLYVVCREEMFSSVSGSPAEREVNLLANEHRRQHQWNVPHDASLVRELCE